MNFTGLRCHVTKIASEETEFPWTGHSWTAARMTWVKRNLRKAEHGARRPGDPTARRSFQLQELGTQASVTVGAGTGGSAGSACVKAAQTSEQQNVARGGRQHARHQGHREGTPNPREQPAPARTGASGHGYGARAGAWLLSGNDPQRPPGSTAGGEGRP